MTLARELVRLLTLVDEQIDTKERPGRDLGEGVKAEVRDMIEGFLDGRRAEAGEAGASKLGRTNFEEL